MIVPRFRIAQTDDHLTVIARVPYVKISNAEVNVEKNKFTFYLKPYLLNLNFQNDLREEEPESGIYDHNTYEITFKLRKKNRGEFFEDTNMINSLMSKKKDAKKKVVKIEVIGGEDFNNQESKESVDGEKAAKEAVVKKPHEIYNYGFNRSFIKFFENLEEELFELADLDPDRSNLLERKELRALAEEQKFDSDHYLADKFDNPEDNVLSQLDRIICQKLEIFSNAKPIQNTKAPQTSDSQGEFTEEEWNIINKLPKKEHLIENENSLILQLIDLLYAFLYEYRSMEGDFTSESGWTLSKLSSTLSCFTEEDDLKSALITSIRRSLIYPIYRHFDLSIKVKNDVAGYLRAGKTTILKAFLKIKYIFERSEPRYLFNTLYIDDFCVFLQSVDRKVFEDLADKIEKLKIEKNDLGLELDELEKDALEVIEEVENEKKNGHNVEIKEEQEDGDDEDEEEDEDDEEQEEETNNDDEKNKKEEKINSLDKLE